MARQNRTQSQLAARLRVSQAAVSRRLIGDVEFTVSELAAVADFLAVPLHVLIPAGAA